VNNDTLDTLQKLYNLPPAPVPSSCAPDYETDSAAEDNTNPFIVCLPPALVHTTEMRPLPLPSTFGFPQITVLGLGSLTEKELQLWEGQANDELQGIRMVLSKKSFLFRKDLRLAQSKLKKGRAWGKVHKVSWRVQAHRQVYHAARAAMVSLGCSTEIQTKYQILWQDQLKVSTAAVRSGTGTSSAELGSQSQNELLAWFWTMNLPADFEASDMRKQCKCSLHPLQSPSSHYFLVYKVHWLRANA
jgi:hypothetical protein